VADTPTTDEVTVTAPEVPLFGDPFTMDSFGLTDYLGGLSLNEYAARMNEGAPPAESFAPPVVPLPVKLLPEVVVEAPTILGSILTGLTALLFPQPMGPREYDEAPGGGGAPPPPTTTVGPDPIMPPNWNDLISEPFPVEKPGPPLVPLPMTPVEMPPGEKFFDVSPPRPTTTASPLLPIWLEPIPTEVPYEFPGEFPLPDFTVDPGPGPAPTPTSTPRVDPVPFDPVFQPFDQPGTFAQPVPTGAPAPDVLGDPFADPIGDPIGDPFASPDVPAGPRGSPRAPTVPDSFASPAPDVVDSPFADPLLTEFGPDSVPPEHDACQCDKKKAKKKKSKPRDVCYRGTYRQNSRGITYNRLEEIPCEAKKAVSKRETDSFGRPVPKKRGKGRTKNWKDTVDEVFGRLI
jgi:hypothetical protein